MGNKLKGEIEENYEPTADEIIKYGIFLGLTLPDDEDLLYIARKGLKDPLPHPWKRYKTRNGDTYYFNFETGQSELQHPRSYHYKLWVRDAKQLGNIKPKTKGLLNYQIRSTNDFNSKLKETEIALNPIDSLRNKTAEILSRSNNPELEMDFRATCSNYQTNFNLYDPPLMWAYQDYLKAYHQKTSLYIIDRKLGRDGTYIEIYNTETGAKEYKIIKSPKYLGGRTCMTQLPNGKLFCCCYIKSWVVVIIDMDCGLEMLPSGTSCDYSSCIYFNNSVYCFKENELGRLRRSDRFDLEWKRWIKIAPMPKGKEFFNNIIFNGNILISGYLNRNLLLYSIDIDSFSTIPYEFAERKSKILINTERLYVIEDNCGSIYECEIGSYTNWRRIGWSAINVMALRVYCSYNKGGIYIGFNGWADGEEPFSDNCYYKFDLNKKLLSKC